MNLLILKPVPFSFSFSFSQTYIYIFLAFQFLFAFFFFHHSHVFFPPLVLRFNSSLSSFCLSLSSLKQVSISVFLVLSPFSCLSFSSMPLLVPFANGTPSSILFCSYVSFFSFYTHVSKSNIQAMPCTAMTCTARRECLGNVSEVASLPTKVWINKRLLLKRKYWSDSI